jgi:hypothetical protein
MDLRTPWRLLLAPFLLIRRFLDWVYAPSPFTGGPSRGESIVHLRAAGAGHDSTKWMAIEDEERRKRSADLRRLH